MLLDFAELTPNTDVLYRSLYEKIKTAVECGAIKKGEKLPSVREAAAQLGVSRTTVENAYARLCIEGIAESQPQRGYYIRCVVERRLTTANNSDNISPVRYDFSTRKIDDAAADTAVWKKLVRSVLWDSKELTSYGDSQGEAALREALAAYTYKARGVHATPDNIIIGAGIGPLLNILCALTGRDITVGFENGGFDIAERTFCDYGISCNRIRSDAAGATLEGIKESGVNVLFLQPSALSRINVTQLSRRRKELADWVSAEPKGLIIEDDYNGELRYSAHTVPAFQGYLPDKTVYIGSFSNLLLPSVRIAYMVLPPSLYDKYKSKKYAHNQTCGKIEQLALAHYISSGAMEKQLRRLRRIYYNKSQILCNELKAQITAYKQIVLYESSLTVELQTGLDTESADICRRAREEGLHLIKSEKSGTVRLCFAGIKEDDIHDAVAELQKILSQYNV